MKDKARPIHLLPLRNVWAAGQSKQVANTMNKILHAVILALFGGACWFISIILRLPGMVAHGRPLPAFTRLCMGLSPALFPLFLVAAGYCVYVWARKAENRSSWIPFLAIATSTLFLLMLPVNLAIYLPVVDSLNHLTAK